MATKGSFPTIHASWPGGIEPTSLGPNNDHFRKELTATLIPSSSALFVLTRSPTPDKDWLLEELKGLGGKILMISLSLEDKARLQAALSATKSAASTAKEKPHCSVCDSKPVI
jgi:hypothetical protein